MAGAWHPGDGTWTRTEDFISGRSRALHRRKTCDLGLGAEPSTGGKHAIWVSESMVRRLPAAQLVEALSGAAAEEIRISIKVRIQERGDGYRVSAVSRRSGEWERLSE